MKKKTFEMKLIFSNTKTTTTTKTKYYKIMSGQIIFRLYKLEEELQYSSLNCILIAFH